MVDYKTIFHLDEVNKSRLVFSNVRNLLNDFSGRDIEVEVLVNSEAVKILKKGSEYEDVIKELDNEGVEMVACLNSLKAFKVREGSLLDIVSVVDSGVSELSVKQFEGFSYIKP